MTTPADDGIAGSKQDAQRARDAEAERRVAAQVAKEWSEFLDDMVVAYHEEDCRFRAAAAGAIGVECEHGYDCCPICDPCTCGSPRYPIRNAEEVEKALRDVISMSRKKLLGIPSKAKQCIPELTAAQLGTLETLIHEALEDLASNGAKANADGA